MENVRFHKQEEKNDPEFAKQVSAHTKLLFCCRGANVAQPHATTAQKPCSLPSIASHVDNTVVQRLSHDSLHAGHTFKTITQQCIRATFLQSWSHFHSLRMHKMLLQLVYLAELHVNDAFGTAQRSCINIKSSFEVMQQYQDNALAAAASLADMYVNNAFVTAHRAHASTSSQTLS